MLDEHQNQHLGHHSKYISPIIGLLYFNPEFILNHRKLFVKKRKKME